jgi:hypothetical protein
MFYKTLLYFGPDIRDTTVMIFVSDFVFLATVFVAVEL